jgi:hypothetical protein
LSLIVDAIEIEQWIKKGLEKTLHTEGFPSITPEDHDESLKQKVKQNVNSSELTMTSYNYKEIAEKYKSDAETVKEAIAALEKEIRSLSPKESDEVYQFLVMQGIGNKLMKSSPLDFAKENAEEFNGVILAVSKVRDLNDYPKRQAWKLLRENQQLALSSGKIRLEKDDNGVERKIPIDMEPTLRDGSANPNYKQPIPYKRARELFMILNDTGELALVRMDIDNVNIGQKSTIYGKKSAVKDKPYKSVIRGWHGAYEESGAYNTAWQLAEKLYDSFYTETKFKDENGNYSTVVHQKITAADVANLPSYGYYVTRGYVDGISQNNDGTKTYLTVSDDDGNKVRSSTGYESIMADIDNLANGDEVIIVIERNSFKNNEGQYVPYNVLMGVTKNNAGNTFSDALKRLNSLRGNK